MAKKPTKKVAAKKPAAKKKETVHIDEKVNKVEVKISETKEFKESVDGMSKKVAELTETRNKEIEEKNSEIKALENKIKELEKQLEAEPTEKVEESEDDLYIAVVKTKGSRIVAIQGGIIGNKKDIERIAANHRGVARRLM